METRHTAYCFGEFTLDLARGALFRSGEEVKLRPKVFEVLQYLVENSGRLIGKEEMSKAIWSESFVTDDSLVQCTVELRRALGDSDQQMIKTIPRRGYLFAAAVHQFNGPAALPERARELSTAQDGRVAVEKLSTRRFDVPVPRTSLIGREKDVTEAVRLLLDPDMPGVLSINQAPGGAKSR